MNIEKNRIVKLFLLVLSKNAEPNQQKELNDILESHSSIKILYDEFGSNEQVHSKYNSYTSFDKSASWSKIESAIENSRRTKMYSRRKLSLYISSFAAIIIAATFLIYINYSGQIGGTIISPVVEVSKNGAIIERPLIITNSGDEINIDEFYGDDKRVKSVVDLASITNSGTSKLPNNTVTELKNNKFVNPANYISKIRLDDGTLVHLNGSSTLVFPEHFSGDERRIELEGEAFFEVVKSDKKFVVSTGGVDVYVYGTKFNVDATREDVVKTVLVEGSVGVVVNDVEVKLLPNDLCVADATTGEIKKEQVDVAKYTAWTRGMFIFEKDNIETLLIQLSQWYDVEFIIENEDTKQISITTVFARDAELAEIIKSLRMLGIEVEYDDEERRYIIR